MIDPKLVFGEQGIGEDDELSHDSGQCDLGLFAVFAQSFVEHREVGIMACGGKRGPVEGAAGVGAAALDVALACGVAAVVGERRDTGQAGDGSAVEGAELGEVNEQAVGDGGADARDRDEDGIAARQRRIGGDTLGDRAGEARDMAVEVAAPPPELGLEEGQVACRQAVGQRRALCRRRTARMHQLLQRLERLGDRRCGLRAERVAEQRQHLGVDAVGLGACTEGFGEQARAQRVDDRHGKARLAERAMRQAMILGRRLDDDERHVVPGDVAFETPDAIAVVGNAQVLSERVEMDVETVFTDVDADIHWVRALCFGLDLALHSGLAPYHLFRTSAKDRRTTLTRGSKPRGLRSRRSGPGYAAAHPGPTPIFTDSRQTEHARGVPIKKIARDLRVSKNTVRKVVRGDETSFSYERKIQPMPKLGPWVEELERRLEANEKKPRRDRLSLLRIHEDLAALGYGGGYDAVRRYARTWRRRWRLSSPSQGFVPLSFDPGEAYQFDWSHEYARLSGVTTKVKAAHMRLCYSRMRLVQLFPRESQEMVFEAHERAFHFFGGVCRRGIYDNMKTAVSMVFVGKERAYNRRFLELCSHHLVEPVACTPGAGWEKGQVERQVGDVRGRLFVPIPRGRSYAEINAWLMDRCIEDARKHPHPTISQSAARRVPQRPVPEEFSDRCLVSRAPIIVPPIRQRPDREVSGRTTDPRARCALSAEICEVLQEPCPRQLQLHDLTRIHIVPVQVKHPLRRIHADDRSVSLHLSPSGLPVKSSLFLPGTLMPPVGKA